MEIIFKVFVIILLSVIAWEDWKIRKIKDKLIVYLVFAGILSMHINPGISVMYRIQGLFLISVPLLVMACIVQGSIGGGDIKLMAAGGFLLGVRDIWEAFVTGIVSAGIYVVVILLAQKAERKSEIALGPFLALGIGWTFIR